MTWTVLVSGTIHPLQVVYLLLLPLSAFSLGHALLGLVRFPVSFAPALLTGILTGALVMCLMKIVLPVSMAMCLLAALMLAVAFPLLAARLGRLPSLQTHWGDCCVVLIALVAATGWCQDLMHPIVPAGDVLLYKPWGDYFKHANLVGMFLGPESLIGLGNYEFRGQPFKLYHYASYTLPAGLAALGPMSGYESLAAFWTPLGTFLLGLAAYALGRSLAGHGGGLCALAGALLLPDASAIGVAHPWFGYYWLLQIGPGNLYGISTAALAVLLVMHGVRHGSGPCLVSGYLVACSILLFKAQVCVVALPLLVGWSLLFGWRWSWQRRTLAGVLLSAGAVGVVRLAAHYNMGPTIRLDGSGVGWYLRYLVSIYPPSPWSVPLQVFQTEGVRAHLPLALAFVLAATFGYLLLLYPSVLTGCWWRRTCDARVWFPAGAIAIYLGCVFGLSSNKGAGTPDELLHRPFLWAYFVVATFTWPHLYRLILSVRPVPTGRSARWVLFGVAALLGVPLSQGRNIQTLPVAWAASYTNVPVQRGLVECAAFIRDQPDRSSRMQDSQFDTQLLAVAGLAERPSFLARPNFLTEAGIAKNDVALQVNLVKVRRLLEVTAPAGLQAAVEATGIRWLVRHPGDPVAWTKDPAARPCFESQGFQVYDLLEVSRQLALRGPSSGAGASAAVPEETMTNFTGCTGVDSDGWTGREALLPIHVLYPTGVVELKYYLPPEFGNSARATLTVCWADSPDPQGALTLPLQPGMQTVSLPVAPSGEVAAIGERQVKLSLSHTFRTPGDSRDLGIKLVSLSCLSTQSVHAGGPQQAQSR